MLKQILLLAAAIGFIADSSIFAADPTPAPSPAKAAVTETASPSPSPAKKTRRRTRVEARRTGRHARREARKGPQASPTPEGAAAAPTPKHYVLFIAICPKGRLPQTPAVSAQELAKIKLDQPERLIPRTDLLFRRLVQVRMPLAVGRLGCEAEEDLQNALAGGALSQAIRERWSAGRLCPHKRTTRRSPKTRERRSCLTHPKC
jgi:hypothetical protein